MKRTFTSESVTCGHPDKVCDQIADGILDRLLEKDPDSRVACEASCSTNQVHIFGEITSRAGVDYAQIARQVIEQIGYTRSGQGFDAASCRITVDLHEDMPVGVDGAGLVALGAAYDDAVGTALYDVDVHVRVDLLVGGLGAVALRVRHDQ